MTEKEFEDIKKDMIKLIEDYFARLEENENKKKNKKMIVCSL